MKNVGAARTTKCRRKIGIIINKMEEVKGENEREGR